MNGIEHVVFDVFFGKNLLRPINPPAPKVLRRCVGSRRLEDQLLDKQLKL